MFIKEYFTCTYFEIRTSNSQNHEILYMQNYICASKKILPMFSQSHRENVHFPLSFPGFP